MKVLIVHGSKMGGTTELAKMLAADLVEEQLDVTVRPAREVRSLDDFDAVIVGGALYAARWHKDARRFVNHHDDALRGRPVWLFSSGPLDDTALDREIPPVRFVEKTMTTLDAAGHITFGGRLPEDAKGFVAAAMAKDRAGDWRDRDQVRHWAKLIAEELGN